MKLIISTAILTTCLFAPIANAKCDANSKTIFSCETKQNKQIELCDLGKTIQYSFGKVNQKSDITLSIPKSKASGFSTGEGGGMSSEINIPNGKVVYTIFHFIDDEDKFAGAGVRVDKSGKQIAEIQCVNSNIVNNLEKNSRELKTTEGKTDDY
jgi:hypothetical protein